MPVVKRKPRRATLYQALVAGDTMVPQVRKSPRAKPKRLKSKKVASTRHVQQRPKKQEARRAISWQPQVDDNGKGGRGVKRSGANEDMTCFQVAVAIVAELLGVVPTWKGEPTNAYIRSKGFDPADGMPTKISKSYVDFLRKKFGFNIDMPEYDYNRMRGPRGAGQPIKNTKQPVEDVKRAIEADGVDEADGVYLVTTSESCILHTFVVEWQEGSGTFWDDEGIGEQLDGMEIPPIKFVRRLRLKAMAP
ncbi:hypothetical protein SDRG_14207 [Saprolegnia diclina VS20]|uniref:Uncharacterized protein n=1 Tax=Saprolegnia diclina (strain VS20) TaxID=1156394 RepID=T0Q0P8_SAPDV|nr:hypothetical protein SDRG_14207 [Saprolegnia diclina VS20]EQC28116.1 hypothetical protein SDRG_14207 [Saprolegnia diclina VS20]|eukprot:XP_008618541.1 hypothetical protein SDRG_14207 [Saprolegnia diclina VS20]